MSIPIIFVHKGDPYYLDFSINQVHFTNPNNKIYLITDKITNRYDFVTYVDLNLFYREANHFKTIYKHMSTNSYENEMFCFQRWFVMKEFCAKEKINDFLYIDSDLLVYCNVDKTFGAFKNYGFTVSKGIAPHCTYMSSSALLVNFCEYILKLYTDPILKLRFEKKNEYHLKNDLPGGVCDMTAFGEFSNDNPGKAKELFVIENDETFDDNINESDGFEMEERKIKKIEMKDGIPYGTLKDSGKKIKFNILHFQGIAKTYLPFFYTGENLKKLKLKLRMDSFIKKQNLLYRVANKLGYETAY